MKNLLLLAAVCSNAVAFSQGDSAKPVIIPDFYSLKMSGNGNIMISEIDGENMAVYDRKTESYEEYPLCSRGLGNSITNGGVIVGSTLEDMPFIISGGEMEIVENLTKFSLCNLHGITSDGSRICGLVNNAKSGGSDDESNLMYLPMYVEVDGDKVSDPIILPHPEKDFVNLTPQYCTATWISDDGRTILGQVIDNSGGMPYPIVYRQDSDGTWSYSLPTEALMNPENLTLPPYPVEPVQPEAEDYMEPDRRAEYADKLAEWEQSGYDSELYPKPTDYMTDEKRREYLRAVSKYEKEAEAFNEKLYEYFDIRDRIFDATVSFVQNAMTMDSDGSTAVSTSVSIKPGDFGPIHVYSVFVFDLDTNTYRKVETDTMAVIPGQITADGTIICSTSPSVDYVTRGFMIKKDSDELLSVQDYLGDINPEYKTWITDNLTLNATVEVNGEYVDMEFVVSGRIAFSDDMSVMAGAVPAYLLPVSEYLYYTYIFDNLTSGIKTTVRDNTRMVRMMSDGSVMIDGNISDLRIMDMEGRTLLYLDEASGMVNTGLQSGLYILTYTVNGERFSDKVMIGK